MSSSGLFSEKVYLDGWWFYIVAPGTRIYRGNAMEYVGTRELTNLEYFSNLETAQIYGPVVCYEVKQGLQLLAMDELANLSQLYDEASESVRTAITSSFGYSQRRQRVMRDSDYDMDKEVADFICSKGLDGYAHEPIVSDTAKDFHPEIALCSPGRKIHRIANIPYPAEKLQEAVRERNLQYYAAEERKARKRPTAQQAPTMRSRRLFEDIDDDDTTDKEQPTSPVAKRRNLFGEEDD